MAETGISPTGIAALKQILWIRDNIDYEKYLLNGDPGQRTAPPLSPQTIAIIKDPTKGWPAALKLLIDEFNLNRRDVVLAAGLFDIQIDNQNPKLKARQLSETILNDPTGASDLVRAAAVVKMSRISKRGKFLLLQILHIRDNIDYEKFLLNGNPAKNVSPPLSRETVAAIKNPEKGWPAALGALMDLFHRKPKDIIQTALLFGIKVDDPQKPQIKARQFSEAPAGLNIKNDSRDLKAALCKIDKSECPKTPDQIEQDEARRLFAEAERLFAKKDYQGALDAANKMPNKYRATWEIQNNIANYYLGMGKLKEALATFKYAQKLQPSSAEESEKRELAEQIKKLEDTLKPAPSAIVPTVVPTETSRVSSRLIAGIKSDVEKGNFFRAAKMIKKLRKENLSDDHVTEMAQLEFDLDKLLKAEKLEREGKLSEAKTIFEANKEISPKAIGRRIENLEKRIKQREAADEKKQAAEAKRLAKEEKQKAEAEARKQAAEAKKQEVEAKKREAAEARRLKAKERKGQEVKDDVIPVVQTAREGGALKEFELTAARYTRELNGAYNRIIKNDPSLKGKVVFKILVELNGRVSRVAWLRGATSDEIINSKNKGPLIDKMIASIKGWKFSKGARTTAEVIAVLTNDAEEKTPEKEEFVVKRLGLAQEKIDETRDRNMPVLVKLCTTLATKNPTLNGTVTVNLVIEPNGKVSSAKAEFSDEMKSAKELDRFKKAVEDAVKKWKFPKAEGQTSTTISLTINQSADKSAPKLETLQQLEKAVKEHPDDSARLHQLAWAKYKTGKYDEAIRIFRELTRTDKPYYLDATKKADCYYGLALAKGRMGVRDEALENYQKAGELDRKYKTMPEPELPKTPPRVEKPQTVKEYDYSSLSLKDAINHYIVAKKKDLTQAVLSRYGILYKSAPLPSKRVIALMEFGVNSSTVKFTIKFEASKGPNDAVGNRIENLARSLEEKPIIFILPKTFPPRQKKEIIEFPLILNQS